MDEALVLGLIFFMPGFDITPILNLLKDLNILKVPNFENDVATKMHKNVVESKFITTFAS